MNVIYIHIKTFSYLLTTSIKIIILSDFFKLTVLNKKYIEDSLCRVFS